MLLFVVLFLYVFCFKQKTAYEMRISDWSSDVCSSDLHLVQHIVGHAIGQRFTIARIAAFDDAIGHFKTEIGRADLSTAGRIGGSVFDEIGDPDRKSVV